MHCRLALPVPRPFDTFRCQRRPVGLYTCGSSVFTGWLLSSPRLQCSHSDRHWESQPCGSREWDTGYLRGRKRERGGGGMGVDGMVQVRHVLYTLEIGKCM